MGQQLSSKVPGKKRSASKEKDKDKQPKEWTVKSSQAASTESLPSEVPGEFSAASTKFQPAKRASRFGAISHEVFIVDNPGVVTDFYDLEKKNLGEGSFGTVCKAKSKSTKADRAIKSVSKANLKHIAKFKQEIELMKRMDHPYIVKLYETFEDHKSIYLVLELCKGGELFDRIIDSGHFKEKQAAILMHQIMSGINYMHQIYIAHRDIKPENFLFSKEKEKASIEESTLKIIDFGLSKPFKPGDTFCSKQGTPYYVAPEVLEGRYDHMCDIWSCGVMMFVLLCGYPPFYGETEKDILRQVKKANLQFDDNDWRNISEDAKRLIRRLLTKDVKDRFTADQAMNDIWITGHAPKAKDAPMSKNLVNNLKSFRVNNKLKKAALHVIASQLHEDSIKALRETFMSLDANGDGLLTSHELTEGLKKAGLGEIPADLQQIMEEVDSDGSGMIDYTEFLAATLDRKTYIQEEACWAAFRVFDRNGDGRISKEELKLVMGESGVGDAMHTGAEALQQIMDEVDANGDGEIDFREFMTMMRASKPAR